MYLSAEKGSAGKEGDTAQRLLPSAGGTQGKCSRCYICQQSPLSPVECQLGHRKPFLLAGKSAQHSSDSASRGGGTAVAAQAGHRACRPILEAVPG